MAKLQKEQREKLQNEALKMIRENPRRTLKDISLTLGLNHGAVWEWKKKNIDGFADRYKEVIDQAFDELELPAIESLGALVEQNNFQAVKYVLDAKQHGAPLQIESINPVRITVTLDEEVNKNEP